MDSKLHILQHAIGANKYGQGPRFRNHFVTGPGSKDYDDCQALVSAGLMKATKNAILPDGDECFVVTPAGINFVETNSPSEPKLTRSQKRYREYLKVGDCFESFRHFLLSAEKAKSFSPYA